MMKLLVYLLFFVFIHNIVSSQSLIKSIPDDCFVIKTTSGVKCYKFNSTRLNHNQSRIECTRNNGDLAYFTDDYTWNLINENNPNISSLWVRPRIAAYGNFVSDTVEVKEPIVWNGRVPSTNYNRCMYAEKGNEWYFVFQDCKYFLPFLCEYNVTYCNVFDLLISNANYNNCHSSYLIKNGDSIEVECWSGFVLSGLDSFVRCENGSWQEPIPKCVPGCKFPGQRKNSKPFPNKLQYNVGEEVAYICDDNYFSWKDFKKAHFVLTCQKDGTWSEENSYCTREKFTTEIIYNTNNGNISLNCTLNGNVSWYRTEKNFQSKILLSKKSLSILESDSTQTKKEGIYFCEKYENGILQFGRIFYKVIKNETCHKHNVKSEEKKIHSNEGHSVIFPCKANIQNQKARWFKNDKEITNYNVDLIVLPNFELHLRNVKVSDEGIYKCEIELLDAPHYCKHYSIIYEFTVTASVESICGLVSNNDVPSHQAPWLVILQKSDEVLPFCYGTLLNSQWIITSASCLFDLRRKKEVNVVAKLQPNGNNETVHPVEFLKVHPGYRKRIFANNIGLVKLEKPGIKFTKSTLPICTSPISFTSKEKCDITNVKLDGEVIGWGSLLIDDVTEMNFAVENMTYISREECEKFYGFSRDMFCAENSNIENIDAGDNGSPFVVKYNGKKYIMGLFNWKAKIANKEKRIYFTLFHPYYNWVRETIENT